MVELARVPEMVHRVARAIDKRYLPLTLARITVEGVPIITDTEMEILNKARAAIAALSDPTDEMMAAFNIILESEDDADDLRRAWRRAIQVALGNLSVI